MIVHNSTKGIITLPVDHKGTVVAKLTPGWSEVQDSAWFERKVKLTDKPDIAGFGEVVTHGAEAHVKPWIDKGVIKVLGEVPAPKAAAGQKAAEHVRRGLTIRDLDEDKATEVINEVNDSKLLDAWFTGVTPNVRTVILNRKDELKKPRSDK